MNPLVEQMIEEMKPTPRQKRKLTKLLWYLDITDVDNCRRYIMPIGMGVPYKGGYAAIDDLRDATVIKRYERHCSSHREMALVQDKYHNMWIRSHKDENIYDDFYCELYHMLYIGVDSESQADRMVRSGQADNWPYFGAYGTHRQEEGENLTYPHLTCNSLQYFVFDTKEVDGSIEDKLRELLSCHEIINKILRQDKPLFP